MDSHQGAEEGLTQPLLKSKVGSEPFPQMESSKTRENSILEKSSFIFVMDDYFSLCNEAGVGQMIESKPFTVGGHTWTIAFYPKGIDDNAHDGGRGYVSLYLCLKSLHDQNQSSDAVDFACKFTMISQSGSFLNFIVCERRMYQQFSTLKSGEIWGFATLMTRAALESPRRGYLRKNCIKIRADVRVFVDYDRFVFFKVGDKKFYEEKSVIAERCPSLLYDTIPNIERIVFEAMLWFIYYGKLHWQDKEAISDSRSEDHNSFALQMLAAADHFDLKLLKRQCQSIILCDNPEVLVLYDKAVSNLKKPWRMACRLLSTKLN